jgi:WD40 repeat protein
MSAWWALARRAVRTGLRAAWSSSLVTGPAKSAHAVDLTGDGRTAVSGHGDGAVRLWDLNDGTCLRALEGHEQAVGSVCLSADGRRLLSSSEDGTIRLWEVDTGTCRRVLTVARRPIDRSPPVRFSADGRQAVVGACRAPLWNLETGDLTRELAVTGSGFDELLKGNSGVFDDLCVGDDGRLAASVTHSGLRLWDLRSGRIVRELPYRFGLGAGRLSLSADGRLVVAAGQDGLGLVHTATGEVLWTFDGPEGKLHEVRMTADGRYAVSGGPWSYPMVWDFRGGQRIRVLDGYEQGVRHLALTPDGRFVLTASRDGLRLWELDWELAARPSADWDDGAAPHLEAFLRRNGPQWTTKDFDALLRRLQDVGYGWLRADGVRARLDRMALGDSATP